MKRLLSAINPTRPTRENSGEIVPRIGHVVHMVQMLSLRLAHLLPKTPSTTPCSVSLQATIVSESTTKSMLPVSANPDIIAPVSMNWEGVCEMRWVIVMVLFRGVGSHSVSTMGGKGGVLSTVGDAVSGLIIKMPRLENIPEMAQY